MNEAAAGQVLDKIRMEVKHVDWPFRYPGLYLFFSIQATFSTDTSIMPVGFSSHWC